jgi:TPR repeat protein
MAYASTGRLLMLPRQASDHVRFAPKADITLQRGAWCQGCSGILNDWLVEARMRWNWHFFCFSIVTTCLIGPGWGQEPLLADGGAAVRAGQYARAVSIYQTLASQGEPKAMASLGVLYLKGLGVTKDIPQAIKWLTLAAEKGDVRAETNLGSVYYDGDGVTQDFGKSVHLFSSAAASGDAGAQFALGVMNAKGQGMPRDVKRAYMWFSIAAEAGLPLATKDRDIATSNMTAGDLQQAKHFITACKLSHYKQCG